ncbi:MAG: hypothetical protein O7C39_03155, partial [Bacteroidetes bacterium]|nr:hypothetical protein [Bacteroidota bacterium]
SQNSLLITRNKHFGQTASGKMMKLNSQIQSVSDVRASIQALLIVFGFCALGVFLGITANLI